MFKNIIKFLFVTVLWFALGFVLMAGIQKFPVGNSFDAGGGNGNFSGDVTIGGTLGVTGATNLSDNMFVADSKAVLFGGTYTGGVTKKKFAIGYNAATSELRCVRQGDITGATKVAFRVTASTVVAIGDAGTINSAVDSGDLYVEDVLEVDGATYLSDFLQLYSRTAAELLVITPSAVGQTYWCSDAGKIAVSTDTNQGGFAYTDDYTTGP